MSADIDVDRLVYAWENNEEYDSSYLSQPWETADETASNDVAGGWACRIGRVILVEQSDGRHLSYAYTDEADAREQWRSFAELYGEPESA